MHFVSLTSLSRTTIVWLRESLPQYTRMADNPLKDLENKIDELIALCEELNRENAGLKRELAGWRDERKDLLDKNELARSKVEAMIERLRTME